MTQDPAQKIRHEVAMTLQGADHLTAAISDLAPPKRPAEAAHHDRREQMLPQVLEHDSKRTDYQRTRPAVALGFAGQSWTELDFWAQNEPQPQPTEPTEEPELEPEPTIRPTATPHPVDVLTDEAGEFRDDFVDELELTPSQYSAAVEELFKEWDRRYATALNQHERFKWPGPTRYQGNTSRPSVDSPTACPTRCERTSSG